MTRNGLIQLLAKAEGITLKAAELAVSRAFESITQTLSRSGRVEIRGFGSFRIKIHEGYEGLSSAALFAETGGANLS